MPDEATIIALPQSFYARPPLPASADAPAAPELPDLIVVRHPASAAAQQYELLAQQLLVAAHGGRTRIAVAAVCPAADEDAAARCVANTALLLGTSRRSRVVVVDSDRNASLTGLLGIAPEPGLDDVLAGRVTIDQALWQLRDGQLAVVPASGAHPSDSDRDRRLGALLTQLQADRDLVLVCGTPVLPGASLFLIGAALDAVILVIQAGRTPREHVALALQQLQRHAVPVLGCVLLDTDREAGPAHALAVAHDQRQRCVTSPLHPRSAP